MSPPLLARLGAGGCLAAGSAIHAQLYLHGYRAIPGGHGTTSGCDP